MTSGTRALATGRLAHGGLPIPEQLITADDVERGKPDPQPYLAGAAALSVDPGDCLVIEDAPAGIEAGKTAGMTVLALVTTFEASALAAADYVVGSLADVALRLGDRASRRPLRWSSLAGDRTGLGIASSRARRTAAGRP